MTRLSLTVTTAALALATSQAWAQTAPDNRPTGAAPAGPVADQADPSTEGKAAAPSTVIDQQAAEPGEIVVTAQRREENAQRIPVAVSVVGGEALARTGAVSIADLATLVPSVTFSAGNELRNNSIRIRGVGTDVFSTGVEPSVSTVVDGVVLQRPGSSFSDLGDIERVEVLRGPQGTLFGKNSSAGVVNIITRAPNFREVEGEARVLVAEDNEYRVNGAISGPITSNLAARVAAFYRTQDGVVDNLYTGDTVNGQEAYGVRAKLAWRPTETVSMLLSGDYSRLDANCCALPLIQASNNPRTPVTGTRVGRKNDQVNNDVDPFVRQKNYGVSLTTDIEVGEHTLTSISAGRWFDNESDVDLDNTQAQLIQSNFNIESSRTFTQELRLTSPRGELFDYVVGGYYFNGYVYNFLDRVGLNIGAVRTINPDGSIVPNAPGVLGRLTGFSQVDTENISGFAQGNLRPTEGLTLTLGLRYLHEEQRLRFIRPISGFFNGAAAAATNPALGPLDGRYGDNHLIGKASATFEFAPRITGYVSYSTGYKSEGLAATLGLSAAQFATLPAPAETSELYEVGLKTQFFDRRLLLNLTGFRTRFNDYQAQTFNSAVGLVVLTSAGQVAIDGFELEFQARPFPQLSVSGGVTYLDARFSDVPNGPCFTGQTAAQGCITTNGVSVQNLNGKPFINAPEWRFTIGGRFVQPITAAIEGYLQADYRWQDDVVFDISQNPLLTQRQYGILDLSAGASFGDNRYEVGVFVRNLFDVEYAANVTAVSGAGGANAYAQQVPRDFRRYFGVSARTRF